MNRQYKRYRGRRVSVRKIVAAVFIISGFFFLFGGVGALDCETVPLKLGLTEAFGGLFIAGIGAGIGGPI